MCVTPNVSTLSRSRVGSESLINPHHANPSQLLKMSSIAESVWTNSSPKLSLSSISSIQTSSDDFSLLWDQAVEEYIQHARLSQKEKEFLELFHTPEEAFNLTRHGWEMNINKKRWRGHERAKTMLFQVLAVFDLLDAAACTVLFNI